MRILRPESKYPPQRISVSPSAKVRVSSQMKFGMARHGSILPTKPAYGDVVGGSGGKWLPAAPRSFSRLSDTRIEGAGDSPSANIGLISNQVSGAPWLPCLGACLRRFNGERTIPIGRKRFAV
ncbi:MAG TPA: hypothetical protein VGQ63_16305 [Pseudolabrys sp.]|jgi:hypothetical protein|nr:hypothetical protein [Pseudolabrys sp.]